MMSSFSVAFASSPGLLPVYNGDNPTREDIMENGITFTTPSSNNPPYGYYASAGCDIAYFFNNNNFYFVSLEPSTVYQNLFDSVNTVSVSTDNGSFYSKSIGNGASILSDLSDHIYSDVNAGYNDCVAFLNGLTPPVPPAISYYTLQNGWLSVIDLGTSGTAYEFDLSTSFQMNSGLMSGTWGNGTTQRYWFSNNLPDENTSYLSTFGNAIEWEKGYPRNVFGQTKNATCSISGTSSGRYLYILNPALQQIADEQSPSINNQSMTISGLTEGISAKIYKLSATATLDGINNAVDITSVGTVSATDTSSDLTNGFTNSDDETVVQNAGGGNENEVAQSVNGYLQGIQNALDNFVNQFIGLLSAPISHIQHMIESGSNFFSVFGQLFTWLPEEISVIITGSLLVMVIIGVFKMFL